MKKLCCILLINLCIIAVFIIAVNSNEPEDTEKNYEIKVNVQEGIGQTIVDETNAVFKLFPAEILDGFTGDRWEIDLLASLDSGMTYESISGTLAVGQIDYSSKRITVAGITGAKGEANNVLIHEMCHYADDFYGKASEQDTFHGLYLTYGSELPISEFFVEKLTAYYCNHEEFKETEKDLYYFFEGLKKGEAL